MKNYRDIKLAHEILQAGWAYLDEQWPILHPDDPKPFLSQVFRPAIVQLAYYVQGRKGLDEVNWLRNKAELAPITAKENKSKVTHAPPGKSLHEQNPSRAFDIAFVKKGTKSTLDWSEPLFRQAAVILKSFDTRIKWGGDWPDPKTDRPHFQC